ncbi:MAG TPA: glycosyltransferase family 4 protein [Caldilineae bacterium]|nr:glycosyltransferase family 4 protein [Caldilineae bacterium]
MSAPNDDLERPRIGLLATLLSTAQNYRGAGLNTYSHQLLRHLPQRNSQFRWLAYVGDANYRARPGLSLRQPRFSTQRPFIRILWEQLFLPQAARRDRLSLLHGLAYAAPLLGHIPTVITVHDLSFLLFPEAFRPGNRLYLSQMTAQSCKRARRVIAVSQATANDLTQLLGIPRTKIDVVYNGVDSIYRPLPAAEVAAYRRQAGWPERFLLIVGTLEPRKNHLILLEAYARYRRSVRQPLPLLIGGGKGWGYDEIFERVERLGLEPHVHFLGYVPLPTLPWLYNAASLFVYPSRYEGFGLPLAEAMACGAPAITTSSSSLPEVAGDAALIVDPDDSDALAQALVDVLNDPDRQEAMHAAGLAHISRFNWAATAEATAKSYTRALELQDG